MSEEIKFELTNESKINIFGIKLFRIKALVDGKLYSKGFLGGWVESLLLKSGDARISDNAWVYGDAEVYGDAWVYGNAEVYGNARVYGNAEVYGDARVYGNAWVYGNARVSGDARVSGRFDLLISCNFELKRIVIDTNEKLIKLKKFLDKF
jgi:hypothetical protein